MHWLCDDISSKPPLKADRRRRRRVFLCKWALADGFYLLLFEEIIEAILPSLDSNVKNKKMNFDKRIK